MTANFVVDPNPGPTLDIWYGAVQDYGVIGTPTPFDNVLGNVSDPSGVTSISYTLNSGPARTLSLGPDMPPAGAGR